MLTEKKINKNWDLFLATNSKYGNILSDEFLNAHGETLKTAKGCGFHRAFVYDGGLVSSIIKTTKFAVSINNSLPESLRLSVDEIIRFIFLSKSFTGESTTNHAFQLMNHGVKLSELEFGFVINDFDVIKDSLLADIISNASHLSKVEDKALIRVNKTNDTEEPQSENQNTQSPG